MVSLMKQLAAVEASEDGEDGVAGVAEVASECKLIKAKSLQANTVQINKS